MLVSMNCRNLGSLMEFISPDRYLATSAQICTTAQPLQMAPASVSVCVLVLNESLKRLRQQPRNGCLPPYGKQLDLEQDIFGKR